MNLGKAVLVSISGALLWLWLCSFGNTYLPERWMSEWYGYPLMTTEIMLGVLIYFGAGVRIATK